MPAFSGIVGRTLVDAGLEVGRSLPSLTSA